MLNHALLGVAAGGGYQMENALLFRGAQYLIRTPTVAGNRKTFTMSCWVRPTVLGVQRTIVSTVGTNYGTIEFGADNRLRYCHRYGFDEVATAAVYRDPSGWMHVVAAVDTTQESASDRVRLWVNGVSQTFSTALYPGQNDAGSFNSSVVHGIGRSANAANAYFSGYVSEFVLIDGAALSPDVFGQIDPVTGSWRPKLVSDIDFGTNGFYLGKPWNAASLGTDVSGRGNQWTPVGFAASDVVGDSPTNVFATLSPLYKRAVGFGWSAPILSCGNLSTTMAGLTIGTLPIIADGKTYFEVTFDVVSGNTTVGVIALDALQALVGTSTAFMFYTAAGTSSITAALPGEGQIVLQSGVPKIYAGDVLGVAVDTGNNILTFYRNGVLACSPVSLASGKTWFPITTPTSSGVSGTTFNFGQRPFAFTSPDGFKALCTANLPATTGQTVGSFTGNANADGPCVYTGAVPKTLSVNGNAVIWGTHADKLATGFKIRTASSAYNASGANSWVATYDKKPTVGPKGRASANAQSN